MKWCWLIGHRFTIQQVGNASVKMCSHCGKSYILMERISRVTGQAKEDFWRLMPQGRVR